MKQIKTKYSSYFVPSNAVQLYSIVFLLAYLESMYILYSIDHIYSRLTALVEAGVRQNASIDIHEDYFEYEDTSVDFTEYNMR